MYPKVKFTAKNWYDLCNFYSERYVYIHDQSYFYKFLSDLNADDLVIITESLEEHVRGLLTWKEAMEETGLRVNAGKTTIVICGTGLDLLQSSGKFS